MQKDVAARADWVSPYRKIDAHAHVLGPKEPAVQVLDAAGVAEVVNLAVSDFSEPLSLPDFKAALCEETDGHPGRFHFVTAFAVKPFESPSYADDTIAQLDEDFLEHGAVGVKVWKVLGMVLKDARGGFVHVDDARFRPIFDYLADRNATVVLHLGDPREAWQPLDPNGVHYRYYRDNPEYHLYGRSEQPSHEEIMRHRDALVARHPYMRFVCAHLASLEHDVDEVAAFLQRFPNASVDTSARLPDLMRQPVDKVRRLFERFPDRILHGTDWGFHPIRLPQGEEEREGELAHLANSFRRAYRYYEETLELAPDVLERFYHGNAERLFG